MFITLPRTSNIPQLIFFFNTLVGALIIVLYGVWFRYLSFELVPSVVGLLVVSYSFNQDQHERLTYGE